MGHLQSIVGGLVDATENESIDRLDSNSTCLTVAEFTCICSVDTTRRSTIAGPTRQNASSLCPAVSGMLTYSLLETGDSKRNTVEMACATHVLCVTS